MCDAQRAAITLSDGIVSFISMGYVGTLSCNCTLCDVKSDKEHDMMLIFVEELLAARRQFMVYLRLHRYTSLPYLSYVMNRMREIDNNMHVLADITHKILRYFLQEKTKE